MTAGHTYWLDGRKHVGTLINPVLRMKLKRKIQRDPARIRKNLAERWRGQDRPAFWEGRRKWARNPDRLRRIRPQPMLEKRIDRFMRAVFRAAPGVCYGVEWIA